MKLSAKKKTKLPKPGVEVEITDQGANTMITYLFMRKAAIAINQDIKSVF